MGGQRWNQQSSVTGTVASPGGQLWGWSWTVATLKPASEDGMQAV